MLFSTAAVMIQMRINGPKVEPAMVITEKTDDNYSYSWTETDLGKTANAADDRL
jgi:hypothetical protein